jgi:hypothetical protein
LAGTIADRASGNTTNASTPVPIRNSPMYTASVPATRGSIVPAVAANNANTPTGARWITHAHTFRLASLIVSMVSRNEALEGID